MSSEADADRISIDTYTNRQQADENLHVYASLIAENGLAGRFGVSVKVDPVRDKKGAVRYYTYDIVLVDRYQDRPRPAFLNRKNFHLRKADPARASPQSDSEPDEEPAEVERLPKNALYKVGGEFKTLQGWADSVGISYQTLQSRLRSGWSLEDALTRPVRKRKN